MLAKLKIVVKFRFLCERNEKKHSCLKFSFNCQPTKNTLNYQLSIFWGWDLFIGNRQKNHLINQFITDNFLERSC